DPAALAAALPRCLADAGERDRMGEAGRLRAEGFSTSSMARGTLEVYQRLLAREHGQGERGAKSRPDRPGA
ncbi:MAG: glycosyltransferase, partial [Alphaproteobacteria bacterium]